ncbi:MAG: hypothetical protein HPY44_10080 [Armatimonadetes bacterium]|nr:hypothetical protein [Armatimonadota bacterium]
MSDFLDEAKNIAASLWRKSRESVDSLAATIDQRSEASKISGKMRNLNREREDLVTEMGKKVYALYRRGKVENLDLLAACKRIDEIGKELEAAREALEKLRNEAKPDLDVPEVTDDTPATVEPAAEPVKEPEPPVCAEPVVAAQEPAPEPIVETAPEPVAPAEAPADAAPEEPQDTI